MDDHRLAHVELEVAPGSGHGHRGVVPVDLDADHDHGLALGRVDLARHDRRAGFVLRQVELPEAAAGTRTQPADVVGDLDQRGGQRPQRPAGATRASWAARAANLLGAVTNGGR